MKKGIPSLTQNITKDRLQDARGKKGRDTNELPTGILAAVGCCGVESPPLVKRVNKERTYMKTTITAKNMLVTPGVTSRIMKKTSRMDRYLHQDAVMNVRLEKEKHGRRIVELTVPVGGMLLRAEASEDDNLYLAIDQALARLEKQIHRHREKLEKRMRTDAFRQEEPEYIEESEYADPEEKRKIVRHKVFPNRPMAVEDAMLQMELLGHSFFVFINHETNQTNVLYLRKDGDLGLLEPDV